MQVSSISKSETDQAAGSNSNTLTGANSAQSIPCYNLIDQTGSTDANFSSPKTKLTGDINMKNVNMDINLDMNDVDFNNMKKWMTILV